MTTPPPEVARIAFYAGLTHDVTLGQQQTVEYDKVITNVGNAYDSRHGHFISPVKGVYLMSFTLMNENGGIADIEMIKKRSKNSAWIWGCRRLQYGNSSCYCNARKG